MTRRRSTTSPSGRSAAASRRLVLEPRMMFDGAALVTAAAVADDAPDPENTAPHHAGEPQAAVPEPVAPAAPTEPVPPRDAGAPSPRAILFVDGRVPDRATLTAGLAGDVELVVLDPARDGLAQIGGALAGRQGVQSLHIVSHGESGTLLLGASRVTGSVLSGNADAVAGWRDALTDDADILLYGCDVGAGEAGAAFAAQLADLTGADVAASTDATGAAARGGDWLLELRTGTVEAEPVPSAAARAAYGGLLAQQPAGSDATVTDTSGGALSVAEDTGTPTTIRLTVPSPGAATQIRIDGVVGGTLTDGSGNPITLGANGTLLTLSGGGTKYVDLRFTPDANRDTAASFTYVLADPVDQNPATNSLPSTATIAITAANDAPALSGAGTVADVAEDTSAPAGTSVSALLATLTVGDADTGALRGIAITGLDLANGVWEFSTNGGTSWLAIGQRDDTTALLLSDAAANRVRFVPAADFNGTATLTVRAWDQSQGTSGNSFAIAGTGAGTAFSAATATVTQTVTAVNDRPTMDSGYTVRRTSVDEDTTPSFAVSALLTDLTAGANLADPDGAAAAGIVVTGTGTSGTLTGTWEYRADGTSPWTALGAVTAGAARLLPSTAELRYVPGADTSGEASLTFHVWDGTGGTQFGTLDTTAGGGTSPFTANSATLSQPVTPVNDAPDISVSAAEVAENATLVLTTAELGITDVDNTAEQLIVRIEGIGANLQLTRTYGGVDVPLAADSLFSMADLASGIVKLRYTGSELAAGDTARTITYTVRDGAGGELANQTLAVTVKDVNAPITVTSTSLSVAEYLAPGDHSTVTLTTGDADGDPARITYTVKSLPGAAVGRLVFDSVGDGSGFADVTVNQTFTQAQVTAGRLRFISTGAEPTGADASATFTVDVTDGHPTLTPSTQSNVTVTLTVTPRNDEPAVAKNSAATVAEGGQVVITRGDHLDFGDDDSARNQLTYTLSAAPSRGVLYLGTVRLGVGSAFQQVDIDSGRLKYVHDGIDPVTATDGFSYTLRDGDGAALGGTFTVNITPVDDPPELVTRGFYMNVVNALGDDTGTLTAYNLEGTDVDTPAAGLTYTITGGLPANTEFRLDGATATTFTQADVAGGRVTLFHTGDGEVGSHVVTLTLSDGTSTVPGTLTIHLTNSGGGGPGNEAPTLRVNLPLVAAEGSAGNTIGATLLKATDPEQGAADLTYTIGTAPTHGDLYRGATKLAAGDSFTQDDINAGQLTFTHDGSEPTDGDDSTTFTFTVTDGAGGSTGLKTFTIGFTPVNDPPTLTVTTTLSLDEQDTNAAANGAGNDLSNQTNAVALTTGTGASVLLQYADPDTTDTKQLVYVIEQGPGDGTISRWNGSGWVALGTGGRFSVHDVQQGDVAYFHDPDAEAPTDTFRVRLTDGGTLGGGGEAASAPQTVTVNVAPVNDAPDADGGSFSLNEGASATLTTGHLGASDSDDATADLTYRITALPSAGSVRLNGVAVTAGTTFTHGDLTGGKVTYLHNGDETFTDSFKYEVEDPDGLTSAESTVDVAIRPQNDAPTIAVNAGITASQGFEGEVTAITTSMLSVADPDNTANQVQIRVTALAATPTGKLFIDNGGGNEVTLGVGSVFTKAQLDAGKLKYRHDGSESYTDSFGFKVSDGSGDGEPAGTFAITVGPVNDSPVLTVPTGRFADEDGFTYVTGISASDVDITGNATATLSVANGVLTVDASVAGGVAGGQIAGNGSATVTLTGTVAAINATLAAATGLKYAPTADYNGTDTLTVTLSDGGGSGRDPGDGAMPAILNTKNTGNAASQSDSRTVAITVRAINDAPSATYNGGTLAGATATASGDEDTDVALAAVTVSDPDVARAETNGTDDGLMQVTVAATNGTVRLLDATGVTGTALTTGAASIVLKGTPAQVDNALRAGNLVFKGSQDFTGTAPVTITVSDMANEGSGGAKTVTGTVNVTLAAVNDAPAISVPATMLVNEDAAFTSSGGNKITLTDPDAGSALRVTLALSQEAGTGPSDADGALNMTTTTGLTFVSGTNNSSGFTVEGSVANLNAALASMQFLRTAEDYGKFTLSVSADDQGNAGSGGAKTAAASTEITVRAVNDDPTLSVGATSLGGTISAATFKGFTEDAAFADVRGSNGTDKLTVADVDLTETGTPAGSPDDLLTVTLALPNANGLLLVTDTAGLTLTGLVGDNTAGFTEASVTGTAAQLNQLLGSLQYKGDADFNTETPATGLNSETLRITLNDNGNSLPTVNGQAGVAGGGTITRDIPLTVAAVNDAPTLSIATPTFSYAAFTENAPLTVSGITIADLDVARGETPTTPPMQVTLQTTKTASTLTISTTGITVVSGNGTNTLVVRGTVAALNTALATLAWRPSEDPSTANAANDDTITVTVSDRGNRGTGGTLTATGTIRIDDVRPVNDAPAVTAPTTVSVTEDTAKALTGASLVSVADADARSNAVELTLGIASGTLTLGTTTGLTLQSGANGSGAMVYRGTVANLNAALATLTYAPALNANKLNTSDADRTLTVTLNDLGYGENNAASGTPLSATKTILMDVAAVNDAPAISVTSTSLTLDENVSNAVQTVTVADADSPDTGFTALKLTLTATHGNIGFTDAVTAGATVSGAGGRTVNVTGTQAQINALLSGTNLRYTPDANFSGADSIALSLTDQGNIGAGTVLTDTETISLTVAGNNDPAVVTKPAGIAVDEDSTVTLGSSSFRFDDPDVVDSPMILRLSVAQGTFTLATTAGLSFSFSETTAPLTGDGAATAGAGDGTADATMTFKGTQTQINAALDGLVYTPTANVNGADALTYTISDLGASGTLGGVQQVTGSIAITIAAINDAPVATGTASLAAVNEDTAAPAGATVTALFGANYSDATDQVANTGGSSATALAGIAIVANTATAAQGAWEYSTDAGANWTAVATSVSATNATVIPAAALLRFRAEADFNGVPGYLDAHLSDGAGLDPGTGRNISALRGGTNGYSTAAVRLSTAITAVNDAPQRTTATVTLAGLLEDPASVPGATVSSLFSGTFKDTRDAVTVAASGGSTANAFAAVAVGVNDADPATEGAWQFSTNGGGSWTALPTGLPAGKGFVLAPTDMLRFVPVADYSGTPPGLAVQLVEAGGPAATSTPGNAATYADLPTDGLAGRISGTSTDTVTLNTAVTAVNDAPVLGGMGGTAAYTENDPAILVDGSVTLADVDSPDLNGGSLTVAFTANGTTADQLGIRNVGTGAGQISVSGTTVGYGGSAIGTIVQDGSNGGALKVTFSSAAATPAAAKALIEAVTFANTSDAPSAANRTLTYTLVDGDGTANGGADTATATATVTVARVNDAPGFTALGGTAAYVEDAAGTVLDADAGLADPELRAGDGWNGAVLNLQRQGTPSADDVFGATGTLDLSGGAVKVGGTTIGTVTANTGGVLTLTFNGNATNALVDQALRQITYANANQAPPASVTVEVNINDGNPTTDQGSGAALSGTGSVTVNLTARNDAPTRTGPAAATLADIVEDTAGPAGTRVDTLFQARFADVDAGAAFAGVAITGNAATAAEGKWQWRADSGGTWTDVATTVADTSAVVLDQDAELRFLPASNFWGSPGALTLRLWDGAGGVAEGAARNIAAAVGGTGGFGTDANLLSLGIAVTPMPDTPSVTNAATTEDTQTASGLVVTRHATDGAEVTDFRITSISGGRLYLNDGTTEITDGTFITVAQGNAGLKFTPSANSTASGSFQVQSSSSAGLGGLAGGLATATITVTAVNDPPVANADTATHVVGGAAATGNVVTNDTDIDGGALSVTAVGVQAGAAGTVGTALAGKYGTLTLGSTGAWTYTANAANADVMALEAGDTLTEVFTYGISDGAGGTASSTLGITITGINEAPSITGGAIPELPASAEDSGVPTGAAGSLLSDVVANIADVDTGWLQGIAVRGADTTNGTVWYTTDGGTNWQALGAVSDAQALLLALDGQTRLYFRPVADFNGTAAFALTYRAWDRTSGTAGGSVDISGAGATGGTTAFSSGISPLTALVSAVNDAPRRSTASVALGASAEDAASPGSATVSGLFTGAFTDAVDDRTSSSGSSPHALAGVAVVGNGSDARGAWQYQLGGAGAWTDVGARGTATALLLGTADRLRFMPAADFNGLAPTLTVRLIDASAGAVTGGAAADLSADGATGGTTAYSDASNTVTLTHTVSAVNDAPTASGLAVLAGVAEDTPAASIPGASVASLFTARFADATDQVSGGSSADTLAGVAITANAATAAQGAWQWSADGTSWSAVGTRAESSALLVRHDHLLRFVPATDFNGDAPALTVRVADSSAGVTSGTVVDLSGAGATGGTTAYSTATVQLVTAIGSENDQPQLTLPAAQTVAEDTVLTVPAITVADIDVGETGGDGTVQATLSVGHGTLTLGTVTGLAFDAAAANGQATVKVTGTFADVNAALATLSYKGAANFNGNDTISLIVTDLGNVGSGGARTATGGIAVTVTPVNDAPALSATTASLAGIQEDALDPAGATVTAVLGTSYGDPDSGDTSADGGPDYVPVTGIAVTGTAGIQGRWQLSSDGGGTWADFPAIPLGSALLLDGAVKVRFVPAANVSGSATLTYRAWDQTGATAGQSGTVAAVGTTGGDSAFGTGTGTLSVAVAAVADAPTLTAPGSVATQEDVPASLPLTAALTDLDGSERLEILVAGVPQGAILSAGTNQGGGTWLLSASDLSGLSLRPAKDYGGSATLTVTARAIEQTGPVATTVRTVQLTVAEVADEPELSVSAASGDEDTAIPLAISSSLTDLDGSESLTITIGGVDGGATLSAGTRNADGTWSLDASDLDRLSLIPGKDSDIDLVLSVTATAQERGGSTVSVTDTLAVTVRAVADAPDLTAPSRLVGKESQPIALDIAAGLTDKDGSETLAVTISGVPDGAALSAGTRSGGDWLLTADQLAGLTVTPAKGSDKDFTLTVTATSTEKAGGSATKATEIEIDIGTVADTPTLAIGGPAAGKEDTGIPLSVAATLVDLDGSETLTLRFDGLPDGTILSQGARTSDGGWAVTAAGTGLAGLTLTPAKDSDADFTLSVTATATEKSGGVATASGSLTVTVEAVPDAPTLTAPDKVTAKEGAATSLPIASALVDLDGSESLALTIAGMPGKASLSAGTRQADGTWLLAASDLVGLTLQTERGADSDFTLSVTATSTEKAGGSASTPATVLVDVVAVADPPNLTVAPAKGNEDTAIALAVTADLMDKDGSETLTIEISGVPEGAVLSAGSDQGGTWVLTADQLAGLTVTPARNSDVDFALTVTATSKEKTGETAVVTATLEVTVDPVPDAPTLAAPPSLDGSGGQPVDLPLASALADVDTSEDLTLVVSGMPDQVSLSAGSRNADGTWTLAAADIAGLTMTADPTMAPPPGSPPGTAVFTLTVTAISKEKEGGDARAFATIPVTMRLRPFTAPDALTMVEDVGGAVGGVRMVAEGGTATITLSVGQGTLTAGGSTGASVTLSGTAAEVNAALAALTYKGAQDYNGPDTLTITSGTATATVPVTVTPVNDAPTVTQPLPPSLLQTGQALSAGLPAGLFKDVDIGDVVTVSVDGMPGWLSFDPGSGTLSGTPGATDAGVYGLTVTGTDKAGASASTTLSITVTTPPPPPPPPVTPPAVTPPAADPVPTATPARTDGLIVTVQQPTGGTPAATAGTPVSTSLPATTLISVSGTPPATGPATASFTTLAATSQSSESPGGSRTTGTVLTGTGSDAPQAGGSQLIGGGGSSAGAARQLNLMVAGTITDQVLVPNATKAFQVPQNVFRHTNPNEQLVLEAKQSSGEALPAWLRFDPSTRTFSGTPPVGSDGTVEIAVTARDSSGAEAVTQFRIQVGREVQETGRPAQGGSRQPAQGDRSQGDGQQPREGAPADGAPGDAPPGEGAPADAPQTDAPQTDGGSPAGVGDRADAGSDSEAARVELGLAQARPAPSDGDAPADAPAAKPSLAAQLRAAGRPGLLAQGRALLDSLLAGGEPPAPPPPAPDRSAA